MCARVGAMADGEEVDVVAWPLVDGIVIVTADVLRAGGVVVVVAARPVAAAVFLPVMNERWRPFPSSLMLALSSSPTSWSATKSYKESRRRSGRAWARSPLPTSSSRLSSRTSHERVLPPQPGAEGRGAS